MGDFRMLKDNLATRAGQYVKQINGYRAFIPSALPPSPAIQNTGEVQTLLSAADRALGRLDGSIQTLPNPDLFVLMYVRKEAVLSSQIEGTQSSLHDILEAEAKMLAPQRRASAQEVVNYIRAMDAGISGLDELPVSVSPNPPKTCGEAGQTGDVRRGKPTAELLSRC